MNKKLTRACSLLAACLGLFTTLPTKAASLNFVPNWGASGLTTNTLAQVSMYIYVPDNVVANPPILVLCHYCGGSAGDVFAEAYNGGIVAACDLYGFIMVVPQAVDFTVTTTNGVTTTTTNGRCWDAGSTNSLTRAGGGDSEAIAEMAQYAITTYQADANRVYVTGCSSGAMMTEVLLALYPDVFKAGAEFSGVPAGGWAADDPNGQWSGPCAAGQVTNTPQGWGAIVSAMDPGYSGRRPRVQLWHGTADAIINYTNQIEAIKEWTDVLGLSTNPTSTATVTLPNITNQWTHQIWQDSCGNTLLDAWSETGGPHGTDALFDAGYVIPFLDLDKTGPLDPLPICPRGRPTLNAARTTFVADDGQPLRGPYYSTEWTPAASYSNIANMQAFGFNAVHLYGESFDPNYPTNGSTAPGYSISNIDSMVASTRASGLYLVLVIGNGAANGDYNADWITNFWKIYAPRYANETHVLFEIQNEPVAWGPPYSATNATPPGALNMEIAAYNTIRQYAPNTPVLLFTYAVLGGTGGADAALQDIHAFNEAVFGNTNAVWTNTAVAFHGYAGDPDTAIAAATITQAGYPCFMTEFGSGTWDGTGGGLDVECVEALERIPVSWLTFQYIPPTGVSDDVTRPDAYINRVVNSGLSWTPDYGAFPQIRGPYGNGGYPWTVPDYTNNVLSGSLFIQAANFDGGGKGVAYYNQNTSNPGGQYRPDETVGIETTSDAGGGYDVGWIAAGDWLEYTMEVPEAGTYNLCLRVAGTSAGSVQVLADDNNMTTNGVDVIGQWTLPNTGGYQTWTTVTNSVFLIPGRQKLHINVLAAGFNLHWIELSPASSGPIANGTYKFVNAADALALDIDTNNNVVTATPSGSNTQQWNIKNIGGGQYEVSSVAKGNSWYTYAAPLHLLPWGWGPGGNTCFIILPATGGYYRVSDSGGGLPFEPSIGDPPLLDQDVWNGSAAQQWAIVSPSAPAFPCGLSVTASSSTQDLLTWNAVGGAGSYNVKRSLTSGGPYTTIATGVATTNYTDTGLAYGTTYYYVVSATVGGVESLNSLEATVAVPYPWMTQDMGAVDLAGSASFSFSNGVFTLTGSGADIWGTGDQFRFVYMPVTGDCTIVALVASVQNIDPWSKAGIMIRESLATNSTDVLMAVTPGNGVTWQYRSSTGGDTANNNTTGLSAPYWVKLVRSGNTFTGYRSPNGQTWTQLGSATFTMASSAYIGLALTSHNSSSLCTATFCNVTAPGWPPSFILPAPPASLSATSVSASQINLTWNATTNTASYNVKRSTTNGGPYAVVATGVTATNYNDTGLAAASTYYYVVSAVNSGGESTNSAQASATTAVAVPAAPTGLSALATSSSQINLTWNATTNTASYDVKRSATSGGPYTIIATGVTTTNYADTNVTVDVEYYYVVSAVIGGVGSLNSAEASAASLRAYLTFDEYGGTTAWDSTENGWNGTLVNGPIWTTGNFGNAVDLEGVSQYVSLPSGVVSSLTNFTMATWVNLGATSTWARVFDFGSGTTAYMFLAPVSGSGTIRFAITTTASGGEQQINGSAPLPTNAWTHVAVTLSGGTGILYVNGVEVGVNTSMTLTPASLGVTTQNYIGKSQYSGDPYLDGLVDEFRIYTDALSAADVAALYAYQPPILPASPASLSATSVSASQINLTWNATTNTASYNVKRSATSGGPYTVIATGMTTTNYSDAGLIIGAQYYYVVSAVVGGVESLNSAQASALPYPWLSQDIGAVGIAGSATYSNGVFAVAGAGADIQNAADAFRFVYVTASGNCTIIARVASMQDIDPWSKAGVMIRASLASNAVNAFVGVTPGNGVTWQDRSSTGGGTSYNNTNGLSAPYWVKLVRSGNTFTGSCSPNGATWTQQGTATLTMASAAYIGLALTSHNSSSLCAATFDNVTAPGWPTSIPPASPASLSATAWDSQVALSWPASSGAISYNVKCATLNGGPYATVTNATTTNYTDNGLINGTNYYYVVSALNIAGESANSAQASATPLKLPQPRIVGVSIVGGSLMFSGTNGLAGGSYTIWSSTNVATPLTNWTQVGSSNFDGNGNFSVTNAINNNETQQFYLLRQP